MSQPAHESDFCLLVFLPRTSEKAPPADSQPKHPQFLSPPHQLIIYALRWKYQLLSMVTFTSTLAVMSKMVSQKPHRSKCSLKRQAKIVTKMHSAQFS
jgi:hypothetical protein